MAEPKLTPTPEQQAVIEAMLSGDSLMVSAYAGSAKTTTLQLAGPRIRVPALALAFNKRIAKELDGRLPGNFSIKTLNGLGFGALTRANPGVTKWEIDDRKLGKLVSSVAKDRKVDLSSTAWDGLRRLVSQAMQRGIVPGDAGAAPLLPDTRDNWAELLDDLSKDEFDFLFDLGHEVLERNIAQTRLGKISFDDQVYHSVCVEGRFPQFPVLFIDEAQDLSPLNHAMISRALRQDGKLVAVGDPKQAIYQFRGADASSMERLRGLRQTWQDLPLATTFRCPKVIVSRQQAHAPGFQAWHTNAEGRFVGLNRSPVTDLEGGWNWASVHALLPSPAAQVAVLCRNNAPLLSLAFKLIRAGVGVCMLGRDIGRGLVALSEKIEPNDAATVGAFLGKVEAWLGKELEMARLNDQESKMESLHDRADCLLAVATSAECKDVGQVRGVLQRLFAKESGQVTLGSIHRSKGLEWDLVLHLDPWRIPSRQARVAAQAGLPEALEQEWNLVYVCETRTKHTLVTADLESFQV